LISAKYRRTTALTASNSVCVLVADGDGDGDADGERLGNETGLLPPPLHPVSTTTAAAQASAHRRPRGNTAKG
jgi:hypothetical protein